jgi:hypothetical protein
LIRFAPEGRSSKFLAGYKGWYMKKLVLGFVLGLVTITAWLVAAQGFMDQEGGELYLAPGGQNLGGGLLLGPGTTYLGPITPNAYGPGINADAAGTPFQWQQEGSLQKGPDPTLKVTPNAYGMVAHADQYGRIVQPVCWFGQSGC